MVVVGVGKFLVAARNFGRNIGNLRKRPQDR